MMTRSILILILCMAATVFTGSVLADSAPTVPVESGDIFYRLGGGKVLFPPGSTYTSYRIRARIKVGLGYSCGKFNFQDNIKQMIDEWLIKIRGIPSQLTMAASAAVAGLPGYLLMKRNPSLYNLITKTLDESAELFRLSYKSCKEIEREMARDPEANPYQGFLKAGVADLWQTGADSGKPAPDIDQEIKDTPPTQIKWIGGRMYGTEDNPVQVNHDIVVAGYNILIGRTGDVSIITAPTSPSELEQPVVKLWSDPEKAGRWVQEVLGDAVIVLGKDKPEPESIPGKGLRPKVEELEPLIDAAFALALDKDDYTDLNKYTSARVSALLIESLRNMPKGDAMVMTDRLVSEMAVSEATERLNLIKQMMLVGLKAPDVSASTGGVTAEKVIRDSTFPDMERVQNEIIDSLELKQRTLNRTTVSILNHAEELRNSAAGASPGQIKTNKTAIGGALSK